MFEKHPFKAEPGAGAGATCYECGRAAFSGFHSGALEYVKGLFPERARVRIRWGDSRGTVQYHEADSTGNVCVVVKWDSNPQLAVKQLPNMLARLPDAPVLLDEPENPAAAFTIRDLRALLRKISTGETCAEDLLQGLSDCAGGARATVRLVNHAFARAFEEGEAGEARREPERAAPELPAGAEP